MKKVIILSIVLITLLTGCKSKETENNAVIDNPSNITVEDNNQKEDENLWNTENTEDNSINTDKDLKESEIYGYSYDENGYLVKVEPDTATNMDGSITEVESVYDSFTGELVKDYSKENTSNSTEYSNKTLISANEYTGNIDIDANKQNWDTLYNNLVSKHSDYDGKVIKVCGVGYVNDNIGKIRVGDSNNLLDYMAAKYPTSGSTVQIIGTITYNSDNNIIIDAEEVAIVY